MVNSLAFYVTLLRRQFVDYCNQRLQELGLSQGLLFFIIYVGKHPGCSPKELAENLQMDTGHAARSLAKLEQAGFLRQSPNPCDKRSHLLNLTGRGQEAFRVSHELFFLWDQELMCEMSQEDRENLLGLLERLTRSSRSGRGEKEV